MYPRKNFFSNISLICCGFPLSFLENIAVPHQTMFNSGKLGNYKNHQNVLSNWKNFFLGILVIYLKRILLLVAYCTVKVQSIIYAIFSGNYLEGLSLFVFQSTKPYLPIHQCIIPIQSSNFWNANEWRWASYGFFLFLISQTHIWHRPYPIKVTTQEGPYRFEESAACVRA